MLHTRAVIRRMNIDAAIINDAATNETAIADANENFEIVGRNRVLRSADIDITLIDQLAGNRSVVI